MCFKPVLGAEFHIRLCLSDIVLLKTHHLQKKLDGQPAGRSIIPPPHPLPHLYHLLLPSPSLPPAPSSVLLFLPCLDTLQPLLRQGAWDSPFAEWAAVETEEERKEKLNERRRRRRREVGSEGGEAESYLTGLKENNGLEST